MTTWARLRRGVAFALAVGVGLLGGYLIRMETQDRQGYHLMVRNFYGALRVRDDDKGTEYATRNLLHGTINHGSERLTEVDKYKVGSYYGLNSGIGRSMQEMQARGPIRYGVVGLGAGVEQPARKVTRVSRARRRVIAQLPRVAPYQATSW